MSLTICDRLHIEDVQEECFETAVNSGFWADTIVPSVEGNYVLISSDKVISAFPPNNDLTLSAINAVAAKLALIHSEVSEALEELREGGIGPTTYREDGKPEGFGSELADIQIRVFDLASRLGYDLEEEIHAKMAYNKTRSYKHGKAI